MNVAPFVIGGAFLAVAATVSVGWERPPIETVQRGYRGLGMEHVVNPRTLANQIIENQVPKPEDPVDQGGDRSGDVYENVQVLQDLGVDEFGRLMTAITNWVSPEQGCTYCHNPENFALDDVYTKVVARKMLQMTQHLNADWKPHVGGTGVTCYTCHRGNPVPANVWFSEPAEPRNVGAQGYTGQNRAGRSVGSASLPNDPFDPFLLHNANIRVVAKTALPSGDLSSIKQTEWTYGLMMHMSTSLGVNCTYCHNTRSFAAWDQGSGARATAWYGIRMVRDINNDYLVPLTHTFPQARLGPLGDVAKTNCATCHQGVFKPLLGVSMLKDYPELAGPIKPAAAALQ